MSAIQDQDVPVEETQSDQPEEAAPEQSAPQAPEQEKDAKPRVSSYVVFGATDDAEDAADVTWELIGTYEVEGNGGQSSAKKQALEDSTNSDYKKAVLNGDKVWLFACPRQSFNPTSPSFKASEPKLVI